MLATAIAGVLVACASLGDQVEPVASTPAETLLAGGEPLPIRPPAQTSSKGERVADWNLVETLGAKELVERAKYLTEEWEGRPNWKRISARESDLLMAPHEVGSAITTTLGLPLQRGKYVLNATVQLRAASEFPVELSFSTSGDGITKSILEKIEIAPGQSALFQRDFPITEDGNLLFIECVMSSAAQNNFSAMVTLEDIRLQHFQ